MTTEPTTRKRMPGAARRVQIRQVAAELFDTIGYRETSMDRIAEEVGIRKASVYYYFPSKDQLLVEMHDEMLDLILAAQEERRNFPGEFSAEDCILGMISDLISLQETHPGSLRVFFEHFRELPEPARASVLERRKMYEGFLREQLRRGVEAGEFEIQDIRLTGFAILGMTNWSYQWFVPGGPKTAAEVAAEFWRMLRDGIGSHVRD